ncbi:MAG: class I SAM-dependent methyltransferase [Lachnospiraceae bacterium]|nr:class I SAM-dependent methyltransferase [Lachnospiraceae bacterium]
MILKEDSTEQKLRGAYYTPTRLAQYIVHLVKDHYAGGGILEPSCGDGVFIDALESECDLKKLDSITAVEIEKVETAKLKKRYKSSSNIKVLNKDFFDFYKKENSTKYGLIVGNPPYIRYQYLENKQRELLSGIITEHGMKPNKLINTWVAFTVACVHMLSDEGTIAFVIPAEILQVAYAEELRVYLAKTLEKITVVTFEQLVFDDIEQEVVVLIGKKGKGTKGIRIVQRADLNDLLNKDIDEDYQPMQDVHEKWTKYFTSISENKLVSDIKQDDRFWKLSDAAVINVGITTGNNKYFSVTQDTVGQYGLANVCRPLIGRSSHANSLFFEEKDWQENVDSKKAAYLIDFPDIPLSEYDEGHREYIKKGEDEKENEGYKCRIRDRWYRIPSIWVPDAFFLRRNNIYPKFVINKCNAVSTDTMHRLKFNKGVDGKRVVLSYYNSISFAFTELCGRSYGGGVLEILPGEVGEIMVPKLDHVPDDVIDDVLSEIDQIIREDDDIEKVLDIVDKTILENYLNISSQTCISARKIWKKLQARRLGRG